MRLGFFVEGGTEGQRETERERERETERERQRETERERERERTKQHYKTRRFLLLLSRIVNGTIPIEYTEWFSGLDIFKIRQFYNRL